MITKFKHNVFNNFTPISKKLIAIFTLLVMLISLYIPFYCSKASNSLDYIIPAHVRIGLTTYYAKKSVLYLNNKTINIGYNAEDFTNEVTFSCPNGFRLENNTSNRMISKSSYDTYEEVLETIDSNNDLLPVMVSEGKWKIATKPNRVYNEISMIDYDTDDKSIVLINGNNKEIMIFYGDEFPLIKSGDDGDIPVLKFPERHYRGYVQIIRNENMTAINYVSMDEYLYSVLASEMSTSWPIEALKAQAITARTFAVKKIYAERFEYYDLVDTTSDQVYKGYTLEGDSTRKATDETSGMILIYVGEEEKYYNKLVDTFYYACSGGVTEEPQNVWNASLPYLKSQKDIYEDENKYYNWEISFKLSDLQSAINKAGKNIGTVTDCNVTLAKESGRVLDFTIVGTKSSYTVSKDSIRSFFTSYMNASLNSTNFTLYSGKNPLMKEEKVTNKIAIINGEGEITYKDKSEITLLNGDGLLSQIGDKLNLLSHLNDGTNAVSEFQFETSTFTNINPKELADNEYLIIGSGWGHGVGMSQYGAKNMAEKDFTYEEILTFYYLDTKVEVIDEEEIEVKDMNVEVEESEMLNNVNENVDIYNNDNSIDETDENLPEIEIDYSVEE